MVTKSDVLNYQPHHFIEFADKANQTGAMWMNSSSTQHAEAMIMGWTGVAASAYKAVAGADHAEVMIGAARALSAAAVASGDGALVWEAQTAARFALEDADAAQVDVSEGFQLSDRLPPSPDPVMRAWRQAEIQHHATQVGAAVSNLVAQDAQAAAHMRVAGDFSEHHTSPNGHIQATDNHFKTDDGDDPWSNQNVPTVGDDQGEDLLLGPGAGGGASTQSGLGSQDTRLPAMPSQWPPTEAAPPDCMTPSQVKDKLETDAEKAAVLGAIPGGVLGGPLGAVSGAATAAITNDTGDLLDILDGTKRLCDG